MKTLKLSSFLSTIASCFSLLLWVIFIFFNPYSNFIHSDLVINSFMMLFLPACLALLASFSTKKFFLLIAFLWSLPMSAYLALTPSIFALFAGTCIIYLISFLLVIFAKRRAAN